MALMLGPQTLISKSTWPRYTKGLINLKPDIHQNIGDNQRKKKNVIGMTRLSISSHEGKVELLPS